MHLRKAPATLRDQRCYIQLPLPWPGTASIKDTFEGDAAAFQQRGEAAGDYSVQGGKGPPITYFLSGCREMSILPEEFLEEQSCESEMVFVALFLNHRRAGSLQLYHHLPLSARLQKWKTKGILFSLPQSFVRAIRKQIKQTPKVTQKLSTLSW